MRVLVTGGAGFIGSHFVRSAVAGQYPFLEGSQITVLDKLTYAGNRANLRQVEDSPLFTFVQGDIADARLVDSLMARHAIVVNFAAETHVDRSIAGSTDFIVTNVLGTDTLLDAANRNGVERFVQISTDEVYGSIDQGSWPETDPLSPTSPYSASKAAGDLLALAYHRTHGLEVLVTRCSNNYGPYQYPEKIVPLFVTRLMQGMKVPLYGDGFNVRDWLHVADHCWAIHLVLEGGRAGEVYNIGGGCELTNRELTERLLVAFDAGWTAVEAVEDRKGHDRRYSVDTSKIATELGYEPRVEFNEGLAQTITWYRDNRQWWSPLVSGASNA